MNRKIENIDSIKFEGLESNINKSFRYYDPDKIILSKSMKDLLRFSLSYSHNFDVFELEQVGEDNTEHRKYKKIHSMSQAKIKADTAFKLFSKLNVPYYCFHDIDVAPEGNSLKEYTKNLQQMVEFLIKKQDDTNIKLLWGAANITSHSRYNSGAITSPDPKIFTYAATQIFNTMDATQQLGGENYLLLEGFEGYLPLLNRDLRQEREQLGRLMQIAVEYKNKSGFKGTILINPKPQELIKQQHNYDTEAAYGLLKQFGLENEIKVNINNNSTWPEHRLHHDVATAISLGILGSININLDDSKLGWNNNKHPNSIEENTLIIYEILKSGGFTTGGFNYNIPIYQDLTDIDSFFYRSIGAMDAMALALERAASLIQNDILSKHISERYTDWNGNLGQKILSGSISLPQIASYALNNCLDSTPNSGQQEYVEKSLASLFTSNKYNEDINND